MNKAKICLMLLHVQDRKLLNKTTTKRTKDWKSRNQTLPKKVEYDSAHTINIFYKYSKLMKHDKAPNQN